MDLRESIHRIHAGEDVFGKRFYDHFFRVHPDARRYFRDTNMQRQAVVFTMQLMVIEAFQHNGTPTAEQYLQVLGTTHQERGVPLELYDGFRDCLLEVLAEFHGKDWDPVLESEWRQAMDRAIDKMAEGYVRRFHV